MPLWTPAEISTALWLDAADASTITESGGVVSQWDDKSGNLRHPTQGTGSRQPINSNTLNGNTVITFDGSSDFLRRGSSDLLRNVSAATVCVVAKASVAPTTLSYVLGIQTSVSSGRFVMEQGGTGSGILRSGGRRLDGDSFQAVTTAASIGTDAFLSSVSVDYLATDLQQFIDGSLDGSSGSFQTSGSTSDTASAAFAICSDPTAVGGAALWGGDVAEVVVVHNDASTATRQKIEGYLAWKWGLESNLPGGHPYALLAPSLPSVSGTVTNAAGGPAARTIRAYNRATGALVGETVSNISTGAWEIVTDSTDEVTVLAIADEIEVYNDIAHRVIPE